MSVKRRTIIFNFDFYLKILIVTSYSTVVRWHSFQSGDRPDNIFKKCQTPKAQEIDGIPLAAMSCGQLQVVRKLALVTLTGYMERYCPTHRSGWNWELPKFIKKIKSPDYKGNVLRFATCCFTSIKFIVCR